MISQLRLVVTAFTFLTRVPLRGGTDDVDRAVVWFPLVGLVVGTVVGSVYLTLSEVTTSLVAAAIAMGTGALLTGGFHEDGLGDMADGFGGGWTPRQRLDIMKDSRLGTYGVLAIVTTVVIRVAALAALTGARAVVLVAAVHLLARTWALLVLAFARPARPDGLGATSSGAASSTSLALVALSWFAVGALAVGPGRFVVLAGLGALGTASTVWLSYRKIDGVTGDVLGAVEQVTETIGLVAATLHRPS